MINTVFKIPSSIMRVIYIYSSKEGNIDIAVLGGLYIYLAVYILYAGDYKPFDIKWLQMVHLV